MAPMRAARLASAVGCLLAVGAGLAGCGGGSGSNGSTATAAASAKSRPAPPKGTFPSAGGKTLGAVLEEAQSASELTVTPEATVFYRGGNRYPFSVVQRKGPEVTDAQVALYFAKVPPAPKGAKAKLGQKGPAAQAQVKALEEPAFGPFPASIESLAVKPAFRAKANAEQPTAAVVYATGLDFPRNGEWRVAALIKEGDEFSAALLPSAVVGEFQRVPRPGQRAPLIHTPVPADVGGDLSKLSTRVPPDTMNKVDYAEVLGKRPIVLLFATPKFCQSRVCGSVVDVAEQAQHEFQGKATFIHMETFNDNDPEKGARPQVRAFHLPTEPWLFTIDRNGDVSSAIEGGFGPKLMTEAVERVRSE
jgi:hypothetical protein